jgi:hypothetical protein
MRGHDRKDVRHERLEDRARILVGHRRKDEHGTWAAQRREVTGERPGARDVVSAVQEHRRRTGDELQPPGPARRGQAAHECLGLDPKLDRARDRFERRHRDPRVALLVLARKRQVERLGQGMAARIVKGRADLFAVPADDLDRRGLRDSRDQRAAGTCDRGLLRRDVGDRAAEDRHVVEIHRDDGADQRLRCVRRIEAAAEADLEHRDVDTCLPEGEKSGGRHDLEERRMGREPSVTKPRLAGGAHSRETPVELGRTGVDAADPDPLVRTHEVRGRVQAGSHAVRFQHGIDHRRNGALAVRAADERRREAPFRMIEKGEQRASTAQAELDAVGLEAVEPCHDVLQRCVPK